jgi:hypothetical protein
MESVSLFSEARNEYLKQLSTWIVPPLVEYFRKEYNTLLATQGRRTMAAFQEFCALVPKWNQDVIETNISALLDNCRCDYVEELMTAVFIAHTKMLTAIRVNSKQKKLQITLPKLDHFLHRVFTECARAFWKAPFLFADELTPIEKQKNILQAEAMCTEALSGAVRSLLPVKNILRDYLEADNDEEEEEEEFVKPVKKSASGGGKKKPIVAPVESSSDEELEELEDDEAEMQEIEAMVELPAEESKVIEPAKTKSNVSKPSQQDHPVMKALLQDLPETSNVPEVSYDSNKQAESKPAAATTVIEKLDTPPGPVETKQSDHAVVANVPEEKVHLEKSNESHEAALVIDTEPTVHFTPYDTVYDETTQGISEIRYVEKVSVEDKPPSTWGMDVGGGDDEDEVAPAIEISTTSESISMDDIEELEPSAAPKPVVNEIPANEIEVEAPLGSTGDFEELA